MKTILVCLDTSPRARNILHAAMELAQQSKAKLALFRVVTLPPDISHSPHDDIFGVSPNRLLETLKERAQEDLTRVSSAVPAEMLSTVEVKVGVPWDAICSEASKVQADVIVIGSHGYTALDRILGTTAAKVVNHATCSVFVVRPTA